jgi:hypothetical protein
LGIGAPASPNNPPSAAFFASPYQRLKELTTLYPLELREFGKDLAGERTAEEALVNFQKRRVEVIRDKMEDFLQKPKRAKKYRAMALYSVMFEKPPELTTNHDRRFVYKPEVGGLTFVSPVVKEAAYLALLDDFADRPKKPAYDKEGLWYEARAQSRSASVEHSISSV